MSVSFSTALAAAHTVAAGQHYPQGALYVVATPIGNLADISLRALHVLSLADVVACEDTRHTHTLLRAYGIDKASHQLLALHQHNEHEGAHSVVALLHSGKRVAYVSDAGTPAISDPGARLVEQVRASGLRTVPVPGASSVVTALSAAGLAADGAAPEPGFVFWGFLPTKTTERAHAVQAIAAEARPVVVLEAPHRIEALAQALSPLGTRRVTVGRELTKQFEDIATMPAEALGPWLAQDANRLRGEFALVIHAQAVAQAALDDRVLRLLLPHLPVKTAVKLCADITGESRNALYEQALRIKGEA